MSLRFVQASGQYLTAGSDASLDNLMQAAMTVSMWLKPVSLAEGTYPFFISKGIYSNENGWHVYGAASGTLYGKFGDTRIQTAAGALTIGSWQHVLVCWNGADSGAIYVDGTDATSSIDPGDGQIGDDSGAALLLASRSTPAASYFADAYLEDVAIWNRQLPTGQIQALAAGVRAGFVPAGLVSWWPLHVPGDEVYHAYADGDLGGQDHGANSNHAALGVAPSWSTDGPRVHWPSGPVVTPAAGGLGFDLLHHDRRAMRGGVRGAA